MNILIEGLIFPPPPSNNGSRKKGEMGLFPHLFFQLLQTGQLDWGKLHPPFIRYGSDYGGNSFSFLQTRALTTYVMKTGQCQVSISLVPFI